MFRFKPPSLRLAVVLATVLALVLAAVALANVLAPGGAAKSSSQGALLAATAGAATLAPPGVSVHNVTQSAASVYKYWTPARMASAIPADVTVRGTERAPARSPAATGSPGRAAGWAPATLRPRLVGPAVAPATTQSAGQPQSQCYHCTPPFTRFYLYWRYRTYPVSTVGKVFFTNNGGNYVCSGSVIFTNTVDTAGHCVANTDGTHMFDSSFLFCPSYNAGVNPAVGCWAATSFVTATDWLNSNSLEADYGAAILSTCGTVNCTSVANVTGFLGVAWNWPEDSPSSTTAPMGTENWFAFGYPAGSPFDGNFIVVAASEFGYEDSDGNNLGHPNSHAMGNDMTGGSSGGPWIWQFGTGNYVNGHNDWRHTAVPTEMNTPYAGTLQCNVWVAAGRSDITC
jgi:hypothetical protein